MWYYLIQGRRLVTNAMMSEGAATKILQKVELLFLIDKFILCMIGQKAPPMVEIAKGCLMGTGRLQRLCNVALLLVKENES